MATHLRYLNDGSRHRGLEGDVVSSAKDVDISMIVGLVAIFTMFFGLMLYCRRCLRPFAEEFAEQERQRRESQSEPSQIMTTEQRKAYISKLLVTKYVLAAGSADSTPSVEKFEDMVLPRLTSTLHNTTDDDNESVQDPCPICLEEYKDGDEICWSHSEACEHVFHRNCIFEWLVRHDECPICRQNFLSLNGIHEHDEAHNDDEHNMDAHADLELARTNDMSSDEESLPDYQAPPERELSPRFSLWSIFGPPRAISSRGARTYTTRRSETAEPRHALDGFTSAEETDDVSTTSSGMEDVELGQDNDSVQSTTVLTTADAADS